MDIHFPSQPTGLWNTPQTPAAQPVITPTPITTPLPAVPVATPLTADGFAPAPATPVQLNPSGQALQTGAPTLRALDLTRAADAALPGESVAGGAGQTVEVQQPPTLGQQLRSVPPEMREQLKQILSQYQEVLKQQYDTGLDAKDAAKQTTHNSCGLAVVYSLLNWSGKNDKNDKTLDGFVKEFDKLLSEHGLKPAAMGALLGRHGMEVKGSADNFDEHLLDNSLRSGQPVVAQVDPGPMDGAAKTGKAHYVIVTGYDPLKDKYTVMDPAEGKEREIPASQLKQSVDALDPNGGGLMSIGKYEGNINDLHERLGLALNNAQQAAEVGVKDGGTNRRSFIPVNM